MDNIKQNNSSHTDIRVFEAFAGYGSQSMAMKRIGVPFEVVGISEIDKYAIQAYMAVHGDTPNFGDISKINWEQVPDFDLFTYSYPCQSISSAGLQKGFAEGSGTTSSLLWECKKAIEIKRPKYLLMENVKALTQKKFLPTFRVWQDYLSSLGYTNFTEVLNAKHYGVPQNRERVFMVSILGDAWFNFPQPIKLEKCLADVLEDKVDEKYFLSEKLVSGFLRHRENSEAKGRGFKFQPRDITKPATCVSTQAGARQTDNFIDIKQIGNLKADRKKFNNPNDGRVYDPSGISPCLNTCGGGGLEPKILQKLRGFNKGGEFELSPTLSSNSWHENNLLSTKSYIRKLTPRECFRLMDVSEEDIDKIQNTNLSNTQQYRMAGNSIVVAVLEKIFEQLFK